MNALRARRSLAPRSAVFSSFVVAALLAALLAVHRDACGEDRPRAFWPAWRGPTGDGVSTETGFPTEWSASKSVRWRTPLPERGNSTPIVWGDRIFVTQPLAAEKKRALLAFDRATGKLVWQNAVNAKEDEPTHEANPYGSPSPVTDGERVIAWFGSTGLVAFDFGGKVLWQRDLGAMHHVFGYGSSPVLHGGRCYLNFGPGVREFLLAVDARSGDIVWIMGRDGAPLRELPPSVEGSSADLGKDINGTWSTPIILREGERDVIVTAFRDLVAAFDASSGELVWKCRGMGLQSKASPVAGEGIVLQLGGKDSTSLAVRQGGKGDVTATHTLWTSPKADARVGTGVITGGLAFTSQRTGIIECAELSTGAEVWKKRQAGPAGPSDMWSSFFLAEGRIYAMNQAGDTFVVRASRDYELLATSSLGEPTNSSVVGTAGCLYLRTHKALWCIGGAAAGLELGDAAPDFDLPGVDGKKHGLSSFSSAKVLAVVFTCNHCPTAQAYEQRIQELDRELRSRGGALVAISPNDPGAVRLDELGYTDLSDSLEEMKLRAKHRGFEFPYLYDGEDQSVAHAYGPRSTPEVFVFDTERRLRYSGRIDDDESGKNVKTRDAWNAVDALLSGRPVEAGRTRSFGCSIKWAEKREDNRLFLEKLAAEKVTIERIDAKGAAALVGKSDKLRLINVWATWCGPCVAELPSLVEANRMYRHRKFEMVTISLDRLEKQGDALVQLEKAQASSKNYVYGAEERDALADSLDRSWSGTVPFTLIVKPDGSVAYRKEGAVDPLELRRAIVDVLGRTY